MPCGGTRDEWMTHVRSYCAGGRPSRKRKRNSGSSPANQTLMQQIARDAAHKAFHKPKSKKKRISSSGTQSKHSKADDKFFAKHGVGHSQGEAAIILNAAAKIEKKLKARKMAGRIRGRAAGGHKHWVPMSAL